MAGAGYNRPIHIYGGIHVYNIGGNVDPDEISNQLQNLSVAGSDPNTINQHQNLSVAGSDPNTINQHQNLSVAGSDQNIINLRSSTCEDGVKDILQFSGEVRDTFLKSDLQDARVGEYIWGEQFRSCSVRNKMFQIGVCKGVLDGVHWLFASIKNCSQAGHQSDSLIYRISQVDGINHKHSYSSFLRADWQSGGKCICRVDDLPSRFTLRSNLWSSHFTVPQMITNQAPLNFTRVSRLGQGPSKVFNFKVNWTVDNLGPQENFAPGESIFSKPFGDVQEEVVMVLEVVPSGEVIDPAGTWSVDICTLHLPQHVRESGLEMKYRISVNGSQGQYFTDTYKEGSSQGVYGSNYNSRELKIVAEIDFLLS